jgi:hypothetical protein
MARNFVFTPPIRVCKKFESNFFSCDWIRLINSCFFLTFYPPSLNFCAKIPLKFSICLVCGTFLVLVVLLTNGKFPFIYPIVYIIVSPGRIVHKLKVDIDFGICSHYKRWAKIRYGHSSIFMAYHISLFFG